MDELIGQSAGQVLGYGAANVDAGPILVVIPRAALAVNLGCHLGSPLPKERRGQLILSEKVPVRFQARKVNIIGLPKKG